MSELPIKFRTWYKGSPPRPTKMKIPGWGGTSNDYGSGATPQPWHCQPFVEGACYAHELVYPFDNECKVSLDNGKLKFDGDFTGESYAWGNRDDPSKPPFSAFAPGHYGMSSSLDLQPPDDYVIRIEPHPRYYTDTIGEVPLAIVGHIQPWWSRIFFIVFKSPWPGQTHIFRKDEPYAQVLFIPKKSNYKFHKMTPHEECIRARRESAIGINSKCIAKNIWESNSGDVFDDKYKQLNKANIINGEDGINKVLDNAEQIRINQKAKIIGKYIDVKKNEIFPTKT